MERNQILKLSAFTFKTFSILVLLAVACIIAGIIFWNFDRTALEGFKVADNSLSYTFHQEEQDDAIYLTELSAMSFYYLSVRYMAIMFVLFYIFRRAMQILQSIKSLETFRNINVRQFQKIGGAFLVLAALDAINFVQASDSSFIHFSLPIAMLIASLLSFLMAEIFKEGNRLMEENQLTV